MPTTYITSGTVVCTTNSATLFSQSNAANVRSIAVYNRAASSGYVFVNVLGIHGTNDAGFPIAAGTDKEFTLATNQIQTVTVVADTNGATIDWGVTRVS
jgi:hypothetical protein